MSECWEDSFVIWLLAANKLLRLSVADYMNDINLLEG